MFERDFERLRELALSPDWPEAVDPRLICPTQDDRAKLERAERILDLMVEEDVEGRTFLDFGCGEGHVSAKAAERGAKFSIGYDIKLPQHRSVWDGSHCFTTDFNVVAASGPYDLILLYDVIDHLTGEPLSNVIGKVKAVSKPGTRVVIRGHPVVSRHGGHVYQFLNKAFAHLVFSDLELNNICEETVASTCKPEEIKYRRYFPVRTKRPIVPEMSWLNPRLFTRMFARNMKSYVARRWDLYLANRGTPNYLRTEWESITREPVESFFQEQALVRSRILRRLGLPETASLPVRLMEQSFIDYLAVIPSEALKLRG